MYLSVDGTVPGANNEILSGNFISKVYEGSYQEVPKFMKAMEKELKDKGTPVKKFYMHFAYCPTCMKEAGTNYVALFAEID